MSEDSSFVNEDTDTGSNQARNFVANTPDQEERRIVLCNVQEMEAYGNELLRQSADRYTVLQLLNMINCNGLCNDVQSIHREGQFDPQRAPRRLIIAFNDVNSQRIALQCGLSLASFPQWRHILLQPYRTAPTALEEQNREFPAVPPQRFPQNAWPQNEFPGFVFVPEQSSRTFNTVTPDSVAHRPPAPPSYYSVGQPMFYSPFVNHFDPRMYGKQKNDMYAQVNETMPPQSGQQNAFANPTYGYYAQPPVIHPMTTEPQPPPLQEMYSTFSNFGSNPANARLGLGPNQQPFPTQQNSMYNANSEMQKMMDMFNQQQPHTQNIQQNGTPEAQMFSRLLEIMNQQRHPQMEAVQQLPGTLFQSQPHQNPTSDVLKAQMLKNLCEQFLNEQSGSTPIDPPTVAPIISQDLQENANWSSKKAELKKPPVAEETKLHGESESEISDNESEGLDASEDCKEELDVGFSKNEEKDHGKSSEESSDEPDGEPVIELKKVLIENPKVVNELFRSQSVRHTGKKRELNILVLGMTGVGKSTFINGLGNYLSFFTVEDALNASSPVCLIPSKFLFTQANYEEIEVELKPTHGKNEENEHFSRPGKSCTQEPKIYRFETNKHFLNIIDTPGIGDTRGLDQDKKNTQKILHAISKYKKLHAICFLFKSNDSRLTLEFRHCITELLMQLHKDATENIAFFFTNARGTFFTPGETMTPLSGFLADLERDKKLRIELTKEHIYCTDSEAFRLVCAHFSGAEISEEEFQNYASSWQQSAAEMHRFIEFVEGRPAHHVEDMLSINNARTNVYNLASPLADVNELIETNLIEIERAKSDIESGEATVEELKEKLMITQIGIEVRELKHPKTVCASPNCVETVKLPRSNQYQTVYKKVCHNKCYLTSINVEKYPEPGLMECAAMSGGTTCLVCGCLWSTHLHIRFEKVKVELPVEDPDIKALLQKNLDSATRKEESIRLLKQRIAELIEEQQIIKKTSLRFGSFLQANAIVPYNDTFEAYLKQAIALEESLPDDDGDRSKLENLKRNLREYQQEKEILNSAQENPTSRKKITPSEIESMKDKLFGLKHTGETLRELFEATETGIANHQAPSVVEFTARRPVERVKFRTGNVAVEKEMPSTSRTVTKETKPSKKEKSSSGKLEKDGKHGKKHK